jgi:hypothetical protein
MTLDPSRRLHERVRAVVRAFERGEAGEPFEALAVDIARFQASTVPGYARLCAARGLSPADIVRAKDAPAVPADAFKLANVFAFDPPSAIATFRTSGTTVGARGSHSFRDLGTYDAGALAFGRRMLLGDMKRASVLVLGPSDVDMPDSSLAHMCALFGRAFDDDAGFFLTKGELDIGAFRARVASLPREPAALVLATSFALVHLIDALGGEVLPLPPRSHVMQTGGFKGRSREVAQDELRRDAARVFGVGERSVVGEYGMTELSSQFYEGTAVDPGARPGVYLEPPWARVVPVHGASLEPVPDGEVGLARIEDLANVDSAFAVLTQDRVRRVPGGFELLGRMAGATPRGCSIAIEEMLEETIRAPAMKPR